MADLNSVTVSGNLTRDPELRSTASGANVASLRIGNKGYGDKSNFFDVVVWDSKTFNLAEVVAQAFSKGDRIQLTGRLQWREWGDEGSKRQAVEIVAQDIVLPPKGQSASSNDTPEF
jgi:single-strand DNA-binding protein